MKKSIVSITFFFIVAACLTQTINLEEIVPNAPLQDSDVGALTFGDVDNDGDPDLMVMGRGISMKSTLYRNDGTGNFNLNIAVLQTKTTVSSKRLVLIK